MFNLTFQVMSKYLVTRKSVIDGSVDFKVSKYSYSWNLFPENAHAFTLKGARSVTSRLNSNGCGVYKYFVEPLLYYI